MGLAVLGRPACSVLKKTQSSSFIHEVCIIAAVVELVLAWDPRGGKCVDRGPGPLANTGTPVM